MSTYLVGWYVFINAIQTVEASVTVLTDFDRSCISHQAVRVSHIALTVYAKQFNAILVQVLWKCRWETERIEGSQSARLRYRDDCWWQLSCTIATRLWWVNRAVSNGNECDSPACYYKCKFRWQIHILYTPNTTRYRFATLNSFLFSFLYRRLGHMARVISRCTGFQMTGAPVIAKVKKKWILSHVSAISSCFVSLQFTIQIKQFCLDLDRFVFLLKSWISACCT